MNTEKAVGSIIIEKKIILFAKKFFRTSDEKEKLNIAKRLIQLKEEEYQNGTKN
jgi:hypothetical protein